MDMQYLSPVSVYISSIDYTCTYHRRQQASAPHIVLQQLRGLRVPLNSCSFTVYRGNTALHYAVDGRVTLSLSYLLRHKVCSGVKYRNYFSMLKYFDLV